MSNRAMDVFTLIWRDFKLAQLDRKSRRLVVYPDVGSCVGTKLRWPTAKSWHKNRKNCSSSLLFPFHLSLCEPFHLHVVKWSMRDIHYTCCAEVHSKSKTLISVFPLLIVLILPAGMFSHHTDAMTWNDSKAHCKSMERTLAVISDDAENDVVKEGLNGDGGWWIGLSRSEVWIWSETGEVDTFQNWRSGEPNNSRADSCVAMSMIDGTWRDEPCEKAMPALCYGSMSHQYIISLNPEIPNLSCASDTAWTMYGSGFMLG